MALASLSKSLLSKMSISSSPSMEPVSTVTAPPSLQPAEPISVVGSSSSAPGDCSEASGAGEGEAPNFLLGSFSPIRNMELYPPRAKVVEEGCTHKEVPFDLLSGESVEYMAQLEGAELLCLTNYRLLATHGDGICSVPVGVLEGVELQANRETATFLCRDARIFKLTFPSHFKARSFYNHFQSLLREPSNNHRSLFAYVFHASLRDWKLDNEVQKNLISRPTRSTLNKIGYCREELVTAEYRRMGMGPAIPESQSSTRMWRISQCNSKYEICATYPKLLVVPNSIPDADIVSAAKFRMLGRLPVVVWRHRGNGCVMARSSQPQVGVFNWRSPEDEKFLLAISRACSCSRHTGSYTHKDGHLEASSDLTDPAHMCPGTSQPANGHVCTAPPQLVVMDLRSYAVTLGNRAKGGGSECVDYYPNCDIRFKGLPNIHSVRKSFQHLRAVLAVDDQVSFLSNLESTQWLNYLCELLAVSCEVVEVLHDSAHPILIHCSDGWDRTTQVVALAQLMLDPYYRTIQGFQVLLEREWLLYGHKFGDRCGHTSEDGNQRCPVFLQWLDCVHQLMRQYPCHFQFNEHFLVKLGQHAYSSLFGTFLGNSMKERELWRLEEETTPIWAFLHQGNPDILNYLYKPPSEGENKVLKPIAHIHRIFLWKAMYCTPVLSTQARCPGPSIVANMSVSESNENKILMTDETKLSNQYADTSKFNGSHDPMTVKLNTEEDSKSSECPASNSIDLLPDACDDLDNFSTAEVANGDVTSNDLNARSDDANTATPQVEGSPELELTKSLSNHEFHESLHKRMTMSSLVSVQANHSSDPINIPLTSDNQRVRKGRASAGNGHIPGHGGEPHEFSDEHFALTPQTHPPSADIEMRPIKNGSCTDSHITGQELQNESVDTLVTGELSHYRLDADGLPLNDDLVQARLKEIMSSHREEMRRLSIELKKAKQMGADTVSKADLLINVMADDFIELPSDKESPSSLVSWDCVDESGEGVRWIPDHAITHCCGCGQLFWAANRKHHCRSCGKVFCGSCSDFYCPVPAEQLFSDVRVCEKCFYKLDGHLRKKTSQAAVPTST